MQHTEKVSDSDEYILNGKEFVLHLFINKKKFKQDQFIIIDTYTGHPLLSSNEIVKFFAQQISLHPEVRQIVLNYTHGITHSKIAHEYFKELVTAINISPLIFSYNVIIVGATGKPNTMVKIDNLILSGNQSLKDLKQLNIDITNIRINIEKGKLDPSKFYNTSLAKNFLQIYSTIEHVYAARFDKNNTLYTTWKIGKMTDEHKKMFCSSFPERDPSKRKALSKYDTIPESTLNLEATKTSIKIPAVNLEEILDNINFMRSTYIDFFSAIFMIGVKFKEGELQSLSFTAYHNPKDEKTAVILPPEIVAMVLGYVDPWHIKSNKLAQAEASNQLA